MKSRIVYIILAVLLGAFGIHNFYSGHTTPGIIKLAVTLLTVGTLSWAMWIWAVIEACTVTADASGAEFK